MSFVYSTRVKIIEKWCKSYVIDPFDLGFQLLYVTCFLRGVSFVSCCLHEDDREEVSVEERRPIDVDGAIHCTIRTNNFIRIVYYIVRGEKCCSEPTNAVQ